jgi:hypothetical protein
MSRSKAPPNSKRAVPVPPIYYAFMGELERHRQKFGVSMWKINEGAGTQEGYYARALYADTPTGRMATWPVLQKIMDVLFPDGVEITMKPWKGCLDASKHRIAISFDHARYDFQARPDWMAELSKKGASKGGRARAAKLSPRRRKAIAKRAARARWLARRGAEISAALDKAAE